MDRQGKVRFVINLNDLTEIISKFVDDLFLFDGRFLLIRHYLPCASLIS